MSLLTLFSAPPAAQSFTLAAIPSVEAWGALQLQPGAASFTLAGVPSAEAWGLPNVAASRTLALPGIASAEAWGALTLTSVRTLALTGPATSESFGSLSLTLGRTLALTGVPSAAGGGTTQLQQSLTLQRVTTFPNGDTLTSTALTPDVLNRLLQTLTCRMLAIDPDADRLAYSKVRLSWPTGGQPAWKITDDVCFVKATEEDSAYNRVRDRRLAPRDAASVQTVDTYTRVWRVTWSFYGPNSFDRARLLKSTLISLDFPADTFAAANLYLVADFAATTRNPELFQGQWWERTDFSVALNEGVEETFTTATIGSAEVVLVTERGIQADLAV